MRTLTLGTVIANDVNSCHRVAYEELAAQLQTELRPEGALETLYVAEVLRSRWRLLRWATFDEATLDEAAKASLSKARTREKSSIRQDTAELRRLRTDRELKVALGLDLPVLVSVGEYLKFTKRTQIQPPTPAQAPACPPDPHPGPVSEGSSGQKANPGAVADLERRILKLLTKEEQANLAKLAPKRTEPTAIRAAPRSAPGRNDVCPCGSDRKFKRCCGHWSKTMPATAA